MTPYYADSLVTLYHGDCLEVMRSWWPEKRPAFDLVVTSPPYNLGTNPGGVFGHWRDGGSHGGNSAWRKPDPSVVIDYAEHGDAMPYAEYRNWQREVLDECWAALADSGAIFYNHKPRVQRDGLLLPLDLIPNLPIRQIITWDRGSGCNFTQTALTPQSEWIVVIAKEAFRFAKPGAAGDVWRIAPESDVSHPAPFPVGLPARAIEVTRPGLVFDPFAGSGSTLRAAKDAGAPGVGIELSERYCEIAAKRLSQEVLDFGSVA